MTSPSNETSASPVETGLDVVLLLLYAPGTSGEACAPVRGITRLQKLLFLLWKEGGFRDDIPKLYNFEAYDFGPCVDDLYDDLEFAEDIKLISIQEVPSGNDFEAADEDAFLDDFGFKLVKRTTLRDFALTEVGQEAAEKIYENLDAERRRQLDQTKRRFNSMPFFELLRYVYRKYPAFAKKSVLSL